MNFDGIALFSEASSLKQIISGNGSGTIPATSGGGSSEYTLIEIPHGHDNDELVFRVMCKIPGFSFYSDWFVAPLAVSGLYATPSIDTANLNIELGQSGVSLAAQPFDYTYRVFIP